MAICDREGCGNDLPPGRRKYCCTECSRIVNREGSRERGRQRTTRERARYVIKECGTHDCTRKYKTRYPRSEHYCRDCRERINRLGQKHSRVRTGEVIGELRELFKGAGDVVYASDFGAQTRGSEQRLDSAPVVEPPPEELHDVDQKQVDSDIEELLEVTDLGVKEVGEEVEEGVGALV